MPKYHTNFRARTVVHVLILVRTIGAIAVIIRHRIPSCRVHADAGVLKLGSQPARSTADRRLSRGGQKKGMQVIRRNSSSERSDVPNKSSYDSGPKPGNAPF